MTHIVSRVLVIAAALACTSGSICNWAGTTKITFSNQGRDPIHVQGARVAIGESKVVYRLNNGNGQHLSLGRNDINLGKLWVYQSNEEQVAHTATITMTEPVYFQFEFSCNNPEVTVEYQRP